VIVTVVFGQMVVGPEAVIFATGKLTSVFTVLETALQLFRFVTVAK